MFSYIASATGLLKCCGQADPRTREVTVVLVIIAAPCGHGVANLAHLFDVFVIELAEVVPNTCHTRHNVRLIAAVRDHVMRSLLQSQMFAPEVPADVHQLNCIERAASLPRRAGGVCALAFERVFD